MLCVYIYICILLAPSFGETASIFTKPLFLGMGASKVLPSDSSNTITTTANNNNNDSKDIDINSLVI